MVVWSEWDSGQIYYKVFENGHWSSRQNAGIVNYAAWSNQIAVDSVGTFHLSFADGHSSSKRDIYYSYYSGSHWIQAERIYRSSNNSAWNRIDVDTNDKIHIVWYHSYVPKDQAPSADIITLAKPKYGSWPSGYENISRNKSTVSIHPSIAARNNKIYSCWMEEGSWRLFFSEKTANTWDSPHQIDRSAYYPDMDIDSSGNIHIVYGNRDGNFHYISRTGGNWKKEVISSGNAPLQFGDIHCNNNILAAAWTQGADGVWGIYTSSKISDGVWLPPIKAGETTGGPDGNKHVQIFLDNSNNAHIVWEGIGTGNKNDIFYKKISFDDFEGTYIEVNKYFLDFETEQRESPNPQTFKIKSSGKESINYSISSNRDWLSTSPEDGMSSGEWDTITVLVNPGNRQPGDYTGTLTITSSDALNSPLGIMINLTIKKKTTPHVQLDKSSLNFLSYAKQEPPSPQYFQIRNSGANTLKYTISSNKSWINISPQTGTSLKEWDTVTVSIDTTSLGVGLKQGTITVKGDNADNSPQTIAVTLDVLKPPIPFAPLNVVITRLSHEGLFLKIYKSKITWQENPKNSGLFNIQKYRIFRKKTTAPFSAYIMIAEVDSNVLGYFDENFSSKEERDQYTYAVCCLDTESKESSKTEASESSNSPPESHMKKNISTSEKRP
jgi:hypothetical protein